MSQDQFIPCAVNPWDEIIPRVWQGGMFYGPQMTPCVPEDQFDAVISMAGRGSTGLRITNEKVLQNNYYISDSVLGRQEIEFVWQAADNVVHYHNLGYRVLVRCQAGYNRSGLVVALAVGMLEDLTADQIIDLIRVKRGEWALCNAWFVDFIKEFA